MDAKVQWWTPEQDAVLIAHSNRSHAWLSEKVSAIGPPRSAQAVKDRRQRLAMSKPADTWGSPEMLARMARLYADGDSAAQIARALNREFGTSLTRCSVIGKTRRLGLSKPERFALNRQLAKAPARMAKRRASPPPPTEAARAFQHGSGCVTGVGPKPPRDITTAGPTPRSLNIRMWDQAFTARSCGWATNGDGDADGFTFCGARRHVGSPYCSDHHRIAYRPAPAKPPSAVKDTAQRTAKAADGEPKPLDFGRAAA